MRSDPPSWLLTLCITFLSLLIGATTGYWAVALCLVGLAAALGIPLTVMEARHMRRTAQLRRELSDSHAEVERSLNEVAASLAEIKRTLRSEP